MANKFYLLWDIYFLNTYEHEKKLKTPERTNGLMKSSKGKKEKRKEYAPGNIPYFKARIGTWWEEIFF